ncbi:hypothetical protein L3Q82_015447, partial [Scortum barcoo]
GMLRQVQRLSSSIKPSSPNATVTEKVRQNTMQWMRINMMILREHYDSVLALELDKLGIFDEKSFNIAMSWAKNRYKRKMTPSSVDTCRELVSKLTQPPDAALSAPPDLSDFPPLPPVAHPDRLTPYNLPQTTDADSRPHIDPRGTQNASPRTATPQPPDPPRPRLFYLLLKIHKDPETWPVPFLIPGGRPIVSDCGSESYQVTEYIDFFLNPLAKKHVSYIKDTYDFVNKLKNIRVPTHTFIFSADVDSLYTNIDTALGVKAVADIFNSNPDPSRPDAAILDLLKITLTCNDFNFN